MDQSKAEHKVNDEIRREVITVRHTTTTREAIRLTISQRNADNGELALATTVVSGNVPRYIESPQFLKDLGQAYINAAHYMEKWNKYVNGKR